MPCHPKSRKPSSKSEKQARIVLQSSSLALPIIAIAILVACHGHRDPQAALDRALRHLHEGDISAAARESKKGYRDFHDLSADWGWRFTILRAKVLHWQGMNDEALTLLSSEPTPPMSGDLAVGRLRVEAVAYASLHKFGEAERDLAEAERLCAVADSAACAEVADTRGKTEMERGHFVQAEAVFQRALASARAHHDRFLEANGLLELSWSADEQTHFDEALDWADAARQVSTSRGFADIAQTALGNMGWAYYKLGDSEKGERLLIEAAKEAESLDDTDQMKWLTALGYVAMGSSDLHSAQESFQHSLKLAQQINSREDIINSLIALAFVSEQTNKLDDAQRYADEALKMAKADGNGRDVVYPLLVEGRVAARRNDASTAESNFREVAKSTDTPVFLKWEAERSLARLYEDENHPGPADAEYRTALSTFEAARCGLHERVDSRLPFLSNAARIYEDYIHFLVAHGKTNEALQVADYTRARTLAEGLGRACKATFAPDPLNAPEIARRAGGTILFYALGQEHSYLWAVTAQQIRMFPLAANQSEIDAAVESYRKKLVGPPGILDVSNDGSVLYQMLVGPAQDLLKQEMLAKNGKVFIIPDGGLNSLNFETLRPQPQRYWIEDVTIANAASLRLLPASRSHGWNLTGKLLLIGNPVAPDTGSDNPYPELPNAAAQMRNIEKYFPGERQTVFAREQATPAAYLKSHPELYSYIHFVAHGTASRMNPLDSAIILSQDPAAGAAAGDDSFKLYARDIIKQNNINHHNPLRTQLVTISSCNSVGNRTYSGEGLVGLSWAFLDAGAHNVIGALWPVSDDSTATLMDRLYDELKRGQPPDAALRSAKLSLLHSEDAVGRPFYWAPFQLYTGR
jgi:CHAT domain-containing protein